MDINELTVSKIKSRWIKMQLLLKVLTHLLLMLIAIPSSIKDNEPWQRYDVTRKTDGAVIKDIMQAFFWYQLSQRYC